MPIARQDNCALGPGSALFALVLLSTISHAQTDEGAAVCGANIVPICYGDHADCSLSTGSEIDLYRFRGELGDEVRLTVSGLSNDLDVTFEVYDSFNNPVDDASCSSGCCNACSASAEFTLPSTDQFTVLVFDSGLNNSGNYVLDLQRIPPVTPTRFPAYGVPESVDLEWASDHDFLSFEGLRNDVVRISIGGLTNDLDCAGVLYSPSNQIVWSDSCNAGCCNACSVLSPNLTLQENGTYNLMLHDAGWNNTGSMSVTVTCLLGAVLRTGPWWAPSTAIRTQTRRAVPPRQSPGGVTTLWMRPSTCTPLPSLRIRSAYSSWARIRPRFRSAPVCAAWGLPSTASAYRARATAVSSRRRSTLATCPTGKSFCRVALGTFSPGSGMDPHST